MATGIVVPKEYETKQVALRAMVDSIVVQDAATCLKAKTSQRDIRSEMKLRHAVLDPFVESAKQNLNNARDEVKKWIGPLEFMDDILATKVKDYEREEKRKADAETERINKERIEAAQKKAAQEKADAEKKAKEEREAKVKEIKAALKAGHIGKREAKKMLEAAGASEEAKLQQAEIDAEASVKAVQDNPVSVKPNTVAVAGVPSRTNYKAEVTNAEALIQAYVETWFLVDNIQRRTYLRQFIMVNEQKLGEEARKVKDSKKLTAEIPGVRFYED